MANYVYWCIYPRTGCEFPSVRPCVASSNNSTFIYSEGDRPHKLHAPIHALCGECLELDLYLVTTYPVNFPRCQQTPMPLVFPLTFPPVFRCASPLVFSRPQPCPLLSFLTLTGRLRSWRGTYIQMDCILLSASPKLIMHLLNRYMSKWMFIENTHFKMLCF